MFQLFEEQEFYNLWETIVPENARLLVDLKKPEVTSGDLCLSVTLEFI